jgi:hypothetical protein
VKQASPMKLYVLLALASLCLACTVLVFPTNAAAQAASAPRTAEHTDSRRANTELTKQSS